MKVKHSQLKKIKLPNSAAISREDVDPGPDESKQFDTLANDVVGAEGSDAEDDSGDKKMSLLWKQAHDDVWNPNSLFF